jgi:hypothetical protein
MESGDTQDWPWQKPYELEAMYSLGYLVGKKFLHHRGRPNDHEAALEASGHACIKAIEKRKDPDIQEKPQAWFAEVVRNYLRDYIRRIPKLDVTLEGEVPQAESKGVTELVDRCINQLPEELHRKVLKYYYLTRFSDVLACLPLRVHRAVVELIRFPRSSDTLVKFTNDHIIDIHTSLRNASGTRQARAQKARYLVFAAIDRFHQALLSGSLVPTDEDAPWSVVFYRTIQCLEPDDSSLLEYAYFGNLFAFLDSSAAADSSPDKIKALGELPQMEHIDDKYGPPPLAEHNSAADSNWVEALIWDVAIGIALDETNSESPGACAVRARLLRREAEKKLRKVCEDEGFDGEGL